MLSRAEFLASLPRKRVTAGVVIRDEAGRVLLVEPTYRPDWLLPGGSVESGEAPAQGAAREVLEELGISLIIGRPLVMQWLQKPADPDGVLHFAYDGGVIDPATTARIHLTEDELRAYRFVPADAIRSVANDETTAPVAAALEALAQASFIELGR